MLLSLLMSGALARKGFRFQDLYLLRRVLREAAEEVSHTVDRTVFDQAKFGIEACASAPNSPTWDSVVQYRDSREVIEVKSGTVTKADRVVFWKRLLREGHVVRDKHIRPVLVVDPSSEEITKWGALGTMSTHAPSKQSTSAQPVRVSSTEDILDEALWWMCKVSEKETGSPPLSETQARAVLANFTLESIAFSELEQSVLETIELLFPDGFSEQLSDLILGWLNHRATAQESRRFFSLRELLGEMGILRNCAAFDTGTITRWKDFWRELPGLFAQGARARLGKAGHSIAMSLTQPLINKALTSAGNFAVIGQGGGGKTALISQFGEEAKAAGSDVFQCSADAVSEEEVEDLTKSLRFRRALLKIREPTRKLYVLVDALDEAEIGLRTQWVKQLARLGVRSDVNLCATVRDSAWRSDGTTQTHLKDWEKLIVEAWPEELIRKLLKDQWPTKTLSDGLVELIRQPLMLDLFWRAFVEGRETQPFDQSMLLTRHQLLSAFWQERLLHSVRHQMPDLKQRIDQVIACAASSIGTFDSHMLDHEALEVMLSESVVVPDGRLNPRYRFRHPLLRDFAIAVWCLSAADDSTVAKRWSQVKGGLQRHGALRAMFEALSDPQFTAEHPHLNGTKILAALLQSHSDAAHHIAQLVGTLDSDTGLDPAKWAPSVQRILPASFGTELLASARLAENISWARAIVNWPLDATWLNDSFANELLSFVASIRKRSGARSADSKFSDAGRAAATTLRQLSEHPRFVAKFETTDRWLKMAALNEVIPLLSDEATFEWVERELPRASWRTREYLLDHLIYLADTDPTRTAAIYRSAVGLKIENNAPVLDASHWQTGLMDHHAIEWSLAGDNQHRGLLHQHPTAFLPVSIDLAEAFSNQKKGITQTPIEHADGELVDDHPDWNFWSDVHDHEPSARLIRAIQKCATQIADADVSLFFFRIAPLIVRSRSLTIQSVYLDLLLDRVAVLPFKEALIEQLLDGKLYRYSAVMYWVETGISVVWESLSKRQKKIVLQHIDQLSKENDESARFRSSRLLACLPQNELSAAQRSIAEERIQDGFHLIQHPKKRFRGGSISVSADSDFYVERAKGWPNEFDPDELRILSQAAHALSGSEVKVEIIQEQLPKAAAAAAHLLPAIEANLAVIQDPQKFWILDALESVLEKYQQFKEKGAEIRPSSSLVERCANIAVMILESTPYGISDDELEHRGGHDTWFPPETLWRHALALADAALVWPPASSDQAIQDRFERILVDALTKGNNGVQVAIAWSIRPWHWFRTEDRRKLHNEMIWETPRQASVLISFLGATQYALDRDRCEIYRLLLQRDDLDQPAELAEKLGELIGHYSMRVFTDIGRSSITVLAREVIEDPDKFPLIGDRESRVNFFRSFAFGMKEEVTHRWETTDLATDFGTWNLKIWKLLLPIRTKRRESEGVVLFALHWLEKKEGQNRDITKLRVWWQHLLPLVSAVASEGGRPDCFTLFFNFRDNQMHHLLHPEELFDCVDSLVTRLTSGLQSGSIDLDSRDPDRGVYSSWREVLQHTAEALDGLRAGGLLQNDFHRERLRELLARMASEAFNVDAARTALYRLQNESDLSANHVCPNRAVTYAALFIGFVLVYLRAGSCAGHRTR
jgi:hypothetical protein